MSENGDQMEERNRASFSRNVGTKATRKLKARQDSSRGIWFGMGMMGLVGWSVVVPTLLGAALGSWIDRRHSGSQSWTLTILILGLAIGCLNSWHWIAKEDREMGEADDE